MTTQTLLNVKTVTAGSLASLQARNRSVTTIQFYFSKSTAFVNVVENSPTSLTTYRKTSAMNED